MTEVVQSFIVGHWAVSRELTVTERHVARSTTNIIEIENHDERKRPGMPRELYTFLVKTFSLEGDLIFYIGIGNGNGMLAAIEMHRTSIYIDQTTKEEERWSL
ncbi:unnamed protein product [Porites lobata]|uniref:Uncharacterized protein n=1 Tax=Porites lobata TaxID=104759 RepID=A0ABN8S7Q5_9CNID|nr:unnamed protein product [Porites lobata]